MKSAFPLVDLFVDDRVHGPSDSLRPPSSHDSSKGPSVPFEATNPSPITSDRTDIEDSAVDEDMEPVPHKPPGWRDMAQADPTVSKSPADGSGPMSDGSKVQTIDTSVPARPRSTSDGTPQSVIHAPEGFKEFVSGGTLGKERKSIVADAQEQGPDTDQASASSPGRRKTPSPAPRSDLAVEPSKPLYPDRGVGGQVRVARCC